MYELDVVKRLVSRYETCNPFQLCDYLNIHLLRHELGEIRGYYTRNRREKFIILSQNLEDHQEWIVCGHELGHAVMHPDLSTPFYTEHTLLSKDKYESQANRFSAYLALTRYEKYELRDLTLDQLSMLTGIPANYLRLLN